MTRDPQAAALADHIFSQTQANISFLVSQNYISGSEASDIISRLSAAQSRSRNDVDAGFTNSMQALALAPSAPAPAPARRNVPQPPPPARSNQARAIWAYNEDGRVRAMFNTAIIITPSSRRYTGGERSVVLCRRNHRDCRRE